MTILSTMRQFVPVYLQNINICLSHVPTPRGRARKEAARVCGGCVCPLYAASGRVCVCACVYALKVARVDGWHVVRVRMRGVDGLRVWVRICAAMVLVLSCGKWWRWCAGCLCLYVVWMVCVVGVWVWWWKTNRNWCQKRIKNRFANTQKSPDLRGVDKIA